MLAALGHEPADTDIEEARAYAGALLLLEAMSELRAIRKMLSAR